MIRPRISLVFLALCGVMLFVSSPLLEAQTNLGSVNLGSSTTTTVTVPLTAAAGTLSSVAVVTGGAANLDFTNAGGGTCVTGSAFSTSCTVQVVFAPKFAGPRSGAVVLADATGVVATVYLRGNGVGPQANFIPSPPVSPVALALPSTFIGLPSAVAIDGSGNVYVGDSSNSTSTLSLSSTPIARVLKETPSGGTYTQTVVATGFYGPESIGIDGAGNLYIHDAGNGSANSDAIYKEVLLNGKYTQSLVAVVPSTNGGADPSPTAVAVDGTGNVYFRDQYSAGIANIYAATLQPDGSYVVSGQLPNPAPQVPGETCNYQRTDSLAVDGNGILYVDGYFTCTGTFQSLTEYAVFAYSSGTRNTPVSVLSLSDALPSIPPANPPFTTYMFADSRGDLFFWSLYNSRGTGLSEVPQTANGYPSSATSTGLLTPYSVAVDASGNIFYSYIGASASDQSIAGVYQKDNADPSTVTFQATTKGVVSTDSPKSVIIENIGNAPLDITAFNFPPDFPASTFTSNPATCNTTVPLLPQLICTLEIEFLPVNVSSTGSNQVLTESVNLATNLISPPLAIPVSGTVEGLPAAATPTFSPAGGTYSAAQTVTLSDTTPNATIYYTLDGSTPTTSSSKYSSAISITGPDTIKAIAIASGYEPSAVATATYSIVLPADFTFTIASSTLTVTAGQSGSASASIQSQNGFAAAITFACSGLPAGATCSFSPATVTPSGTAAVPVTVTIAVPSSLGALHSKPIPTDSRHLPGGTVYAVALLGLSFLAKRRTRYRLLSLVAIFAVISLAGCSGGSNNGGGGSSHSSTVTVTATSGTVQHAATIALTIP